MKRYLTLFFFASLFVTTLFAQVSLGVNFFYNQAWQQYDENQLILRSREYIHTFGGAATVQYAIDAHFSLGAEPGFVQRGATCLPGFLLPFGGDEGTLVGNYIEMPITVQYHLNALESRLQFFAKVGAGYSYMVSGYRDISFNNDQFPPQHNRLDFKQEPFLNRLDFGFYGGGGLGVRAGVGYITAEYRYYQGMPDVNDFQVSKNRAMSFGVGYRIAL